MRLSRLAASLVVGVTAASTVSPACAQLFDYAVISDENTPIPSGTGNFTFSLNPFPGVSNGTVLFRADGAGGQVGIYSHRAGVLDVVFNQDTPIPGGSGRFTNFWQPTFSPEFDISFRGEGADDQLGIYFHLAVSGALSRVADRRTDVPGTGGAEQFIDFTTPWTYDGEVVFRGLGSRGSDGIYTYSGGTLRVVADTTTSIPRGTGRFTSFGIIVAETGRPLMAPSIDGGNVAFYGTGTGGQQGIYAEIDGTLIKIADKSTQVPGFPDPFPGFDENHALAANFRDGEILFIGNDVGLYKYSEGALSPVVNFQTVNPESGGLLRDFGSAQGYSFHDGDVSFLGSDTVDPQSIFAFIDDRLHALATVGEVIEGRVVGSPGTYGQGIYDGSVAFNLGDPLETNVVAIQEHRWLGLGSDHYHGTGDGDHWEDPANWPFGLLPRHVVPTVIEPAGNVTIHGPHTNITLSSLQVGGGTGIATLWLNVGAVITVPTATITDTGVLAGNGTMAGDIVNHGLIRPDNVLANNIHNNASVELATIDARLAATLEVTNDGLVSGNGTLLAGGLENNGLVDVRRLTINGDIDNLGELRLTRDDARIDVADEIQNRGVLGGSGRISAGLFENYANAEVRIAEGERLTFNVNSWDNSGLLDVRGGEFESNSAVTNFGAALIAGRDASFRFGGGLTNNAAFAISFGTSDVVGEVDNNEAGRIVLTGNSNTTFYDDVTNDGTFQVSSGSTVVFLGALDGANGTSGSGTVFVEGDLRPGNSPAAVSFGGNLHLGAAARLEIELSGTISGSEHDALDVAGEVTLDGVLDVVLSDLGGEAYAPSVGDEFEIIAAAGGVNGQFATASLPDLGPLLAMALLYEPGAVILSVVAGLPGDYNADGIVDAADYVVWRKSGSSSEGYNEWRANFGNAAGAASGSTVLAEVRATLDGVGSAQLNGPTAAVPEPAGSVLVLTALVVGLLRRQPAS